MPAQPGPRSLTRPLGLVAAGVVGLASVALVAASPARSRGAAAPPSAGRTLDIRLAEAAPPKLAPASAATPLDVRPVQIDAPVSPAFASAQADADLRAQQAAEARQTAADVARERQEETRIDAQFRDPYALRDVPAHDPDADADNDDDADDDGA